MSGYILHRRQKLSYSTHDDWLHFPTRVEALGEVNACDTPDVTFRLYELGRELPLKLVEESVPQPPVVRQRYVVEGES